MAKAPKEKEKTPTTPRKRIRRRGSYRTLQALSEKTGFPYMSIRDVVLAGKVPHVRLGDGRRIWVKDEDFERFLAASTGRGPR